MTPKSVGAGTMPLAISLGILVGCGGGWSPTQSDPANENQAYMVAEARRIEGAMGIGAFVVEFGKPPSATYAGWANCVPGGSRPPYVVGFNEGYVAGLRDQAYMTALVAHEMCHHYVVNHDRGGCWDEAAAEACAGRYAR